MYHSLLVSIFLFLVAPNNVGARPPHHVLTDSFPLVSFPVKKSEFPKLDSAISLVKSDLARVQRLVNNAMARDGLGTARTQVIGELDERDSNAATVEATNTLTGYTMMVGIGNPPTQYELAIDTGSSNTWIGNKQQYQITNTSVPTTNNVSVIYGSGQFSGQEYLDQVTISPGLVIQNQSIGVSTKSVGFTTDGLLGVGPFPLSIGTLSPEAALGIRTVTQNLANQSLIPNALLGVSFQPTTTPNSQNGALTFGGVDQSRYVGDITYVSVPKDGVASRFWGAQLSLGYGKQDQATPILQNSQGFFDTGATLILLNTTAWKLYQNATGAEYDETVGLLKLSEDKFKSVQSLWFNVGGSMFEFTPNAQRWPRSLNTLIGGDENTVYLIVWDLGKIAGAPDLDFVCGYTFQERFYTVYDTDNNRVGIANTNWTHAEF